MRHRILSTGTAIIATAALLLGAQPITSRTASAQGVTGTDCQLFQETGKYVCESFLQYWNDHGGLRQQGYPISDRFSEVSPVDGKVYQVQYFERAEFEQHADKPSPNNVELSLLGVLTMQEKYPGGPSAEEGGNSGQYFAETKQYVSGDFLDYWNANGGLAQQGFPISGRFTEKSDLDGKNYTVQYFERAVFELHPENDAANRVLLTQLGTQSFKQEYPGGDPDTGELTILPTGTWGGDLAVVTVQANTTHIELSCAHAEIPNVLVARGGKIDMGGTFVQEQGGPLPANAVVNSRPARFTGTTDGKTLSITITLTDDNTIIGTYKITLGDQGHLIKCL